MSAAIGRENLEMLEARLQTSVTRHQEVQGEREALADRLAVVERAYQELEERLRRYESERAEIRSRLAHILDLVGLP